MFRREAVVNRYHDRLGLDCVVTRGAVVGVEVAQCEPAAMEIHGHRVGARLRVGPVHADRYGPARPVDLVVFHSEFGVNGSAWQVTEHASGRLDPAFGRQLERHRIQYLLQDGIDRWFVGWAGHDHTVRTIAG